MSRASAGAVGVGDTIAGRYRLIEEIGQGGMGRVYRGLDETLSRAVAIKILLPQYAVQEQSRKRFVREAKVTATLAHPSAIRIYDFGVDGKTLYLVMELITGSTLRDVLTLRHQLPPEDAIEVARNVADVLALAHEMPLIHRDLKPENIMLRGDPVAVSVADVVVLDFGMAFIADDDEAAARGMGRLTKEGFAGGTPVYMSPEQVQGVEVTGAADIYALGCVLFEMLAGEPPFGGPMMKILTKHMYQPAPDVRTFCPEAPQALVELVERMLAKRPAERPSAATVCTRISALAPAAGGARERSRDHAFLATREARMISAPTVSPPTSTAPAASLSVAVIGPIDDDLALALAASGIFVLAPTSSEDADVVFVARAEGVDIASVCRGGDGRVPVVVASETVAIGTVSDLLRAGVAEIVTLPVGCDELAKKLRRAARKNR